MRCLLSLPLLVAWGIALLAPEIAHSQQPAEHDESIAAKTTLAVQGSRFTLNGKPTFLLGISYYGGLGAREEAICKDLDDMQNSGFNWLRVWATWESFGRDDSAVDAEGGPRESHLKKLQWLVAECDRRGMIVDVTLTRGERAENSGGRIPNFPAHQRAVETIVEALKPYRNWYLDLANEGDVRDARFVGIQELKSLRDQARRLNPNLLVTASFGGHDLSKGDVQDALEDVGVDFLSVHRPRHADSPAQTEARTREVLAIVKELGRFAPVHHQEPFRRGYEQWNPTAEDFLTDLKGAVAGGAAGWCFHNGSERGASDQQPRRSFDLGEKRLFEQLDAEERQVVAIVKAALEEAP